MQMKSCQGGRCRLQGAPDRVQALAVGPVGAPHVKSKARQLKTLPARNVMYRVHSQSDLTRELLSSDWKCCGSDTLSAQEHLLRDQRCAGTQQ